MDSPQQANPGRFAALNGYLYVLLFLASLIVPGMLGKSSGSSSSYPTPWSSADSIHSFYATHQSASVAGSMLQALAAVALIAFGAVLSARLAKFAFGSVQARMTLSGGILSAGFMLLGALSGWLLSRDEILANIATLRSAQDLTFLAGGVGHVLAYALLIGPTSMLALATRFMPRWLGMFGLLIALCALLSVGGLATQGMAIFLPIARFASLIWIAIVSTYLLRNR